MRSKMKHKGWLWTMILVGIGIAAGAGLLRLGLNKTYQGVLIGVGAGMFGVCCSKLWMGWFERKNPELQRQSRIEEQDERNTIIRNRAKAKAGEVLQWLVMAMAYLLILIDAPLWAVLLTVGVFLIYNVLSLWLVGWYGRQM